MIAAPAKQAELDENGSTDASYATGDSRFRATAFSQRGLPSFVFRAVPDAPDADALGLPPAVVGWAGVKRGLVVVTGPTGSGKSTTCAAVIDRINSTRDCHILTIEDPIEFLHQDKRAIVCQREIGQDAPSYHVALRAAMRQDPDVIMVGEVRDEETAMTALRAAETGHLVLCTMHTIDAADTIQRFVDFFGEQRGPLARQMLAGTLVGVCSQRLIPGTHGGMALNAEVLINTVRIEDLVVEGMSVSEVHKAISEGDFYGMQSFDQSLLELVKDRQGHRGRRPRIRQLGERLPALAAAGRGRPRGMLAVAQFLAQRRTIVSSSREGRRISPRRRSRTSSVHSWVPSVRKRSVATRM